MTAFTVGAGDVEKVRDHVINLMWHAFPGHPHHLVAKMFFESKLGVDYDLLLISSGVTPIACAFLGYRSIRLLGTTCSALTVGLVAVKSEYRRRGHGAELMSAIDDYGRKAGADLIYLQGIENFYLKFGYRPFLSRTKIIFDVSRFAKRKQRTNAYTRPAAGDDLAQLSSIYECSTANLNGAAIRGKAIWSWLLGPATESWYFPNPKIVEYRGSIAGYFTVDNVESQRIREVLSSEDAAQSKAVLGALELYARGRDIQTLELMTWRNSSIAQQIMASRKCSFVELRNPAGGMLVKFLNPSELARKISIKSDSGDITRGSMLVGTLESSGILPAKSDRLLYRDAFDVRYKKFKNHADVILSTQNEEELDSEFFLKRINNLNGFIFQGDNF